MKIKTRPFGSESRSADIRGSVRLKTVLKMDFDDDIYEETFDGCQLAWTGLPSDCFMGVEGSGDAQQHLHDCFEEFKQAGRSIRIVDVYYRVLPKGDARDLTEVIKTLKDSMEVGAIRCARLNSRSRKEFVGWMVDLIANRRGELERRLLANVASAGELMQLRPSVIGMMFDDQAGLNLISAVMDLGNGPAPYAFLRRKHGAIEFAEVAM